MQVIIFVEEIFLFKCFSIKFKFSFSLHESIALYDLISVLFGDAIFCHCIEWYGEAVVGIE